MRIVVDRVLSRLLGGRPNDTGIERVFELLDRQTPKKAYDALCELLSKEPSWPGPILAVAYTLLADLEIQVNGDVHKARNALDSAGRFEQATMDYYYAVQGRIEFTAGNPRAAVEWYEKSIAVAPCVGNFIVFGLTLSAIQDRRASEIWARAIEADPNVCLAHVGLARETAKSGDRDRTLSLLKQAERLHPSADDALDIAILYHEIGDFRAALSAYVEADKSGYDKKAPLYAATAECCRQLRRIDQAQSYALAALRYDPNDSYARGVWRNVAVLISESLATDQSRQPIDIWAGVIREDPRNCLAHIALAREAAKSGDRDKTLSILRQAEQLHPLPYDFFDIAGVYHMIGEFRQALSAYLQVQKTDCDPRAVLLAAMADCYMELGQLDEARRHIRSAVECDPQDEYVKSVDQDIGGRA